MRPNAIKNDLYPLLKLAFPLILTGMVGASIGFFETVFLAHLSKEAMAAGALVSWLFGVFIVIIFGTLSSINVLIAHKHGAQDERGISRVLRDGLILAVFLSIPAIFLFWNMAPIFLLFGQEPSMVKLAEPYLHALTWGLLPTFIFAALNQLIIGLGHGRLVMIFTTFSVLFALFFSFALIFGKFAMPALGISGAGWGIVISDWIMVFLSSTYLMTNKRYQVYVKHIFQLDKPFYIWELLKVGLPMGVMYCFEVGFFFALTLMMGSLSPQLLAANQIALQYMGTLMGVIFSVAQAVTVRMGHLIGAHDILAAKRTNYAGLSISITFMSLIAVIYWLCPNLLISIDLDVNNPENSSIVHYAKQLLYVSAVFQLFEATRITLFGALRALKDTHFTLVSSIISFWGIAFPIGYLLLTQFNMGGAGLWAGMAIGACFSMSVLIWRFNSKIHAKIDTPIVQAKD
ncbi:TPA: MATE family efflux transporter [Legionella pneumophila]